jgi:hypothetical protein
VSNNRIVLEGLDALRAELRRMPAELAGEASPIVTNAAERAVREIRTAYQSHARTGNLAKGLKTVALNAGAFGAGAEVRSSAKHAYMFENGTQARHTAIGANRGSMPAGHAFIPAVIRSRRAMYASLKALLERHGATVTGDAG